MNTSVNTERSLAMHNCSKTKEQITELLLDGADRRPDAALLAQLRGCPECRAEFNALNGTLRITTRLKETSAPPESYWIGYHSKLRQRIEHLASESPAMPQRRQAEAGSFFARVRLFARTAVPVPVPVIIAVTLAALGLFTILATQQPTPQSPLIVYVPVEVPVTQEKIVTRVVYRERRSPARISERAVAPAKVDGVFAKSQKPQNAEVPGSLMGFKPTEEVKLTVIKGGSQNEK
jgi:hypothetical protein